MKSAVSGKLIIRAGALVLICAGAVYWMNLIFDLRIKELRVTLKSSNQNQVSFRTLALISRYQLIRERMFKKDEGLQYTREGKTMFALSQNAQLDLNEKISITEKLGIASVNGLNWISGSPPLRGLQSSAAERTLELAYLYEIGRDYAKAVVTYNVALGLLDTENAKLRQFVFLHRGFCLSLLDKRVEALEDFSRIIQSNADQEIRYTAEILATMLQDFQNKSAAVDALVDSEYKAEEYYRLASYKKAIDVYKRLKAKLSPRASFYLGRSNEEVGETKLAVSIYRSIIKTDPQSPWALKANRRLYALGAFYGGDKSFRDESRKNAIEVVNDTTLAADTQKFDAVLKQVDEREKLKRDEMARAEEQVQLERERQEKERLEKERLERERLAREQAEKENQEKSRLAAEQAEKERVEKERVAAEIAEREKIRAEQERLENERKEKERLAKEAAERLRLEKEQLEQELRSSQIQDQQRRETEKKLKMLREREASEKAAAQKAKQETEKKLQELREKDRLKKEKERKLREMLEKEKQLKAQQDEQNRIKARQEKEKRDRLSLIKDWGTALTQSAAMHKETPQLVKLEKNQSLLTREDKKSILMSFREIEMLELVDGNRFWGLVIAESNSQVKIFTVMGKLIIRVENISKRETMLSTELIK